MLFGYSPRHDSAGIDQLLAGYQGYLVADAHVVYDQLYADGTVVEVGCWAHQRRCHRQCNSPQVWQANIPHPPD